MTTNAAQPFVRVRFTWLAYFMLAYYSYMQATLGPLMSFLRSELDLSYSVGGLHISGYAFGMVVAGLVGDRLARRWGRRLIFWSGGLGMAAGALGITIGGYVAVTLIGTLLMGLFGPLLLMMIQATLSDLYGKQRTIALTEANIGASLSAMLAPLLIGGFSTIGFGWRVAIFVMVAVLALLIARFSHEPVPAAQQPAETNITHKHLPAAFWGYWTVLFMGVAVEWCMVAWGSDFLETVVGLSRASAAGMVGLFFLAMVVGRAAGSCLARYLPSTTLLILTILMTLAGFPLFWLGSNAAFNLVGLFITGLGAASLFPLSLSVALGVVPDQTDLANARILLGIGLAILITPLFLGGMADRLGIQNAYGIVGVILVTALGITFVTNRLVLSQRPALMVGRKI